MHFINIKKYEDPKEILFLTLPFQHSENIKYQKIGIKILQYYISKEKNQIKNELMNILVYSYQHYKTIKLFNRFLLKEINF